MCALTKEEGVSQNWGPFLPGCASTLSWERLHSVLYLCLTPWADPIFRFLITLFHTPLIHGYSHLFPRSASVPSCREQAFDCNIEWLPLPCLQRKNVNGSHILNSNFFLQSFFTSPCLQTPLSCLRLPVDERRKWNCKFLWRRNLKTNHLLLAEHFVGWYILF